MSGYRPSPSPYVPPQMTKREWFAGLMVQQMIIHHSRPTTDEEVAAIVRTGLRIADALLAELEPKP